MPTSLTTRRTPSWLGLVPFLAAVTVVGSAGQTYRAPIIALLVAVAATIALFRRTSTPAAWLLVPYLAWVGFATALTVGIVVLN